MTERQLYTAAALLLLATFSLTLVLCRVPADPTKVSEVRQNAAEPEKKPEEKTPGDKARPMRLAIRFEKAPKPKAPEAVKTEQPKAAKPAPAKTAAVAKAETVRPRSPQNPAVGGAAKPAPATRRAREKTVARKAEYKPDRQLMRKGARLIGARGEKANAFPNIVIDNESHYSPKAYVRAMQSIGGRFLVMDMRTWEPVGTINFDKGRLDPGVDLSGMSAKTRFVDPTPILKPYIAQAGRRRPGNYSIALIWPLNTDLYLAGAVGDVLKANGLAASDVEAVSGVYRRAERGIAMQLQTIRMKNGANRPIDVTLHLGA